MPFSTLVEQRACIAEHLSRVITPAVLLARCETSQNPNNPPLDWLEDEIRASMTASRKKAAKQEKKKKAAA